MLPISSTACKNAFVELTGIKKSKELKIISKLKMTDKKIREKGWFYVEFKNLYLFWKKWDTT